MQEKRNYQSEFKVRRLKKSFLVKRKMGKKPISNMASDQSCRQEITLEKKHREVMLSKREYRRLL